MRSPVMKVIGVLLIVLVMLSGSAVAVSDPGLAKITPLSAWYEQSAVSEWSLFTQSGMALEIKIEASEEIKIWPSDFAIGYVIDGQEYRLPGSAITNAVSDPEDERSWRFSQPITVRKGTRYFCVLFSELSLSLDQTAVLHKDLREFKVFYRVLLPGDFTVEFPWQQEVGEDDDIDYFNIDWGGMGS